MSDFSNKRIAHIVPNLGVGGAEVAAVNIADKSNCFDNVEYLVFPVCRTCKASVNYKKKNVVEPRKVLFSYYLGLIYNLIKYKPDAIICSLWKSVFPSIILNIAFKVDIFFFLHSSIFFHPLDAFFSKLAMKRSKLVLVDSSKSYDFYQSLQIGNPVIVFSLLMRRLKFNSDRFDSKKTSFVFVGRIDKIKNIERAISIFYEVYKVNSSAFFDIFGPHTDHKYFEELSNEIRKYGLQDAVKLKGHIDFDDVPKILDGYMFYLQTSHMEGMAISVAESMQLGLVPIITSVGEICNYCTHGLNSIDVDEVGFGDLIKDLVMNKDVYRKYSSNSSHVFSGSDLMEKSLEKFISIIQTKKTGVQKKQKKTGVKKNRGQVLILDKNGVQIRSFILFNRPFFQMNFLNLKGHKGAVNISDNTDSSVYGAKVFILPCNPHRFC